MSPEAIARLIDESPMNRGLSGAAWIADQDNTPVVIGEDVFLFEHCPKLNITEFHWLQTVSKGRLAITRTLQAFDAIFSTSDTLMIFGAVSNQRRDVKLMARWIGAKSVGFVKTEHGICEIFILTREMRQCHS